VLPPPEITFWRHDFKSYSLKIRPRGAAPPPELRAFCESGEYGGALPIEPNATGEFLIEGLAGEPVHVRLGGGGWASECVVVDPKKTTEVDLDIVPSGTLKFVARSEQGWGFVVTGTDPVRTRVSLRYRSRPRGPDVVDLPPGKYSVSSWSFDKSVDVTITAGEVTDLVYGPEYTSTLMIRTRDRADLWSYEVEVLKDGKPVEVSTKKTYSRGDEYFSVEFEAEGKLVLRITGEEIETFEHEFTIAKGGTESIEIELKRKQ
jgi:hypothetical protein